MFPDQAGGLESGDRSGTIVDPSVQVRTELDGSWTGLSVALLEVMFPLRAGVGWLAFLECIIR